MMYINSKSYIISGSHRVQRLFDFTHVITSFRDNMPAVEISLVVERATSIAPTMGALYIGAMLTAMFVSDSFSHIIC